MTVSFENIDEKEFIPQEYGVDILFAITGGGGKAPKLPLREELLIEGVELVYNAKGTGKSAVSKDKERRDARLIKKLKRLENKLDQKGLYKGRKKRKKALAIVKDLRKQLENSAIGISYQRYLDELNLMKKRRKQKLSFDDSSQMSGISVDNKTEPIERKVMNAIQTILDDPDINIDTLDDETASDTNSSVWDFSTISMDSSSAFGGNSIDVSHNDNSTIQDISTIDNNNEDDNSVSKWNNVTTDTKISWDDNTTFQEESSVIYKNNETDNRSCNDVTVHSMPIEINVDGHISENEDNYRETYGSSKCKNYAGDNKSLAGDTIISGTSSKTTIRMGNHDNGNIFRHENRGKIMTKSKSDNDLQSNDLRPPLNETLAQAKALLESAKSIKESFSNDSADKSSESKSHQGDSCKISNTITSLGIQIVAESNRYHLFVSHACPLSHMCLIVRALKRLENTVSITYVNCKWEPEELWESNIISDIDSDMKCWSIIDSDNKDKIFDAFKNHYIKNNQSLPMYVPVLWDKKKNEIASNTTSEIMKILNSEFNFFSKRGNKLNLFPADFRRESQVINKLLFEKIYVGIYKCGLATSQDQYNTAVEDVTSALDEANQIVQKHGFLVGQKLTECDVRLFVFLFRFDEIYRILFKVNTRTVARMPGLMDFMRDIYHIRGIRDTCNFERMKKEFYATQGKTYIVPRDSIFTRLISSNKSTI